MTRTLLIATSITLSSALLPFVTNAADAVVTGTGTESAAPASTTTPTNMPASGTTTPSASTDMPKDSWLGQMSPLLPDVVCKGFMSDAELKKRFDDLKITYEKCVTLIPDISTKCQKEIYANVPAMINDENASKWGRTLGECIGKNFAEQYLIPKS